MPSTQPEGATPASARSGWQQPRSLRPRASALRTSSPAMASFSSGRGSCHCTPRPCILAYTVAKERRTLVVVPRETPLSTVHLRNMLSLAEMGVALVPAMPAFYHQPRSIADLVAFVVGKVLDVMKIPNDCFNRYGNFIDADNADRL